MAGRRCVSPSATNLYGECGAAGEGGHACEVRACEGEVCVRVSVGERACEGWGVWGGERACEGRGV